jgi:acyl-[acyl-carrier-protein] desaturase
MTSSKWNCQPLIGAAVASTSRRAADYPSIRQATQEVQVGAARSAASRPIPSAALAGDDARGSPTDAAGGLPADDEILWPLLRYWNLFSLEGLQPQAEQARERLAAHLAKTDRLASRFEAKRAATTTGNEHRAAG